MKNKKNWTQKDLDKLASKVKGGVSGKVMPTKKPKAKTASKLKGERCSSPSDGWAITILGEVPSSKNSRINTYVNGVPRSLPSEATQRYIKDTLEKYESNREKFQSILSQKQAPFQVYIKILKFVNNTWDYHNLIQIVADMMVKAKWIDDDDRNNLQIFCVPYTLVSSKEEAGIVILF